MTLLKYWKKNYLKYPHFIKNEDDYYYLQKMEFNTGIFLNMFERYPLPYISLTETNLLFNFYITNITFGRYIWFII